MTREKYTISRSPNRWHPSVKGINFDPSQYPDELDGDQEGTLYLQRETDGIHNRVGLWMLGPHGGPGSPPLAVEMTPANTVNVVSFGADPSGRTGSGAAINRALDAALARRFSRVYIPAGNYLIDETIIQPSLIWLHGDGMSSYLRAAPNLAGAVIKSLWVVDEQWSYMQALSDLRIDGNREQQIDPTGCYGIEWAAPNSAGVPRLEIELIGPERVTSATPGQWFDSNRSLWNLWVSYCGDTGVYMTGRGGVQGYNIVSYENGGHGFRPTYDSNWQNCVAARNTKAGFYLDDASIRLTGCKAWWSGYQGLSDVYGGDELLGHGFHVRADYGVTMAACEAQDNYANGFYFETAKMCSAFGCVADSNNKRNGDNVGIDFWESNNCVWEGNIFDRYNDSVRYQSRAIRFRSNSQQNQVKFHHRHYNGGASTSPTQYLTHIRSDSTLVNNNQVIINNYEGWQSSGSGTISPTVYAGKRCFVNLTADTTIEHVAGQAHEYCEFEFCFLQDSTGGWTVTFSSDFDLGSGFTVSSGAGTHSIISFFWNGFRWAKKAEITGV